MRIAYDILLSLTVRHLYYSNKEWEDFTLTPDENTAALLRRLRLLPKKKANTWNLFFQREGPFATSVESLTGTEFVFHIRIDNPAFYSVTKDDYINDADEMVLYQAQLDERMLPEKRKLHPLTFMYTIHHMARPVVIRLLSAKGEELIEKTITDPAIKVHEMKLSDHGEGVYNLVEDTLPPIGAEVEEMYAREPDPTEPFYGVVYFKIMPPDQAANANEYMLDFESH